MVFEVESSKGAVPFSWEEVPGKRKQNPQISTLPKHESANESLRNHHIHLSDHIPSILHLPRGDALNESRSFYRTPGSVPFKWEATPGIAKIVQEEEYSAFPPLSPPPSKHSSMSDRFKGLLQSSTRKHERLQRRRHFSFDSKGSRVGPSSLKESGELPFLSPLRFRGQKVSSFSQDWQSSLQNSPKSNSLLSLILGRQKSRRGSGLSRFGSQNEDPNSPRTISSSENSSDFHSVCSERSVRLHLEDWSSSREKLQHEDDDHSTPCSGCSAGPQIHEGCKMRSFGSCVDPGFAPSEIGDDEGGQTPKRLLIKMSQFVRPKNAKFVTRSLIHKMSISCFSN